MSKNPKFGIKFLISVLSDVRQTPKSYIINWYETPKELFSKKIKFLEDEKFHVSKSKRFCHFVFHMKYERNHHIHT